jgi:hypothetical protein
LVEVEPGTYDIAIGTGNNPGSPTAGDGGPGIVIIRYAG